MFKIAYIKLTLFYVLIVMAISLIFSIAIYQISVREIGRGLNRQQERIFIQTPPLQNYEDIRNDQINESNTRLKYNLFYYNLVILFVSLFGSYFLARKTLKPIEEAMEAQSRFTADASHELRTPLSAMKAEIEVSLRNKNMGLTESKKLLKSNLEEIEKLEKLSTALLKIARTSEEKKNFERVELDEVITEAFEKLEKLATKKDIEFDNKLIHAQVLGEKQSLVELFVILLDNAIKYSAEKTKINILMQKEGHHVVVKIKDHGVGIKASDLPYIFNRFYRADTSRTKEQVDGYGLGLAIAKQIVDFHSAVIMVTSKPGKGTEFKITFKRTL